MFRKISLLVSLSIFLLNWASAQETWSLQRCIEYAKENSLNMRQAEYAIQGADLNKKQAQFSRLPNIDGTFNGGIQFGRTIDPTTNSFRNQEIGFNSYSVNGSLTLFSGNQIHHTIQQSKLDLEAARLDGDATFNNMALGIATAYLQVLLSEEQLENARQQVRLTQDQLDQTDKLIDAGVVPANDRLDLLAQLALNEQSVIQAQNAVEINYLSLKQMLEVDPSFDMKVERPEVLIPADLNPDNLQVNQVYSSALGTQPQIRAGQTRLLSAEKGVDVARSSYWPTVTLFGSLTTNWSSVGQKQDGFVDFVPVPVQFPDGTEQLIQLGLGSPLFVDANYSEQFAENLGQSFGVNVRVPIYNNSRNKIATDRAKLNVLSTKVSNDQIRQQLKADVQRAVADAKAAQKSFEAAQKSQVAAAMAFDNAKRRYELGAINTLEYTTAKTNLEIAEVEVIRSKYQYVFNLKIVDFYLGKELTLD
jgi:outer membrane protein